MCTIHKIQHLTTRTVYMSSNIATLERPEGVMFTVLNDLIDKVLDQDLSKLSDKELKELYHLCEDGMRYYEGMQRTVKDLANSVYGASGSPWYRYCNYNVAQDITHEGKRALNNVEENVHQYYFTWSTDTEMEQMLRNKFGEHIKLTNIPDRDIAFYGDTDSRYLDYGVIFKYANFTPKNAQDAADFVLMMHNNRIAEIMRKCIDEETIEKNGEVGHMLMELEVIGGKGIFTAKKKYIMSLLWKDGKFIADQGKTKAVGIEIVQGSSSKLVKDSMRVVLDRLLMPNSKMEDILKIGNAIVNKAKSANIMDICKVTSINKYEKYIISEFPNVMWKAKTPPQVKAAAYYHNFLHKNNLLDMLPRITQGGKFYWYYTADGGVFGVPDEVEFEQLGENIPKIDVERQINNLIIRPLRKFLYSDEIDVRSFGTKTYQKSIKITNEEEDEELDEAEAIEEEVPQVKIRKNDEELWGEDD